MKRLTIAIIAILLLVGCRSKRSVAVHETRTVDTAYVETESEHIEATAFDWSALGLSFDSIVIVTEPMGPLRVIDSLMRPPPAPAYKTSMKVYGGNLSYNRASGEDICADAERSIEATASEENEIDSQETAETQAATPSMIIPWRIIVLAVLAVLLILFRKRIIAVARKMDLPF